MRSIWKFGVLTRDTFVVEMPKGAKILSVGLQAGVVQMWALVDPNQPKVNHRFVLAGTGFLLPDEIETFTFVGTFQLDGGHLVFHLFDAGEVP